MSCNSFKCRCYKECEPKYECECKCYERHEPKCKCEYKPEHECKCKCESGNGCEWFEKVLKEYYWRGFHDGCKECGRKDEKCEYESCEGYEK